MLPWSGTYRGPSGGNVPAYIANDDRFKISTGNDLSTASPSPAPNDYYGTKSDKPAWLYPEDGRMVPGPYETNLGGDDWVADAAIKVIENEDWSGSAPQLQRHRQDRPHVGRRRRRQGRQLRLGPRHDLAQVHMPWIAKNADDQVGRS